MSVKSQFNTQILIFIIAFLLFQSGYQQTCSSCNGGGSCSQFATFHTPDEGSTLYNNYQFVNYVKATSTGFTFQVKAAHDASIGLFTTNINIDTKATDLKFYRVNLGTFGNTKSGFFYVRLGSGSSINAAGTLINEITYTGTYLISNIQYVGVASGWGSAADWKFTGSIHTNNAGNPYKQYTFLNNLSPSGFIFSLKGSSNANIGLFSSKDFNTDVWNLQFYKIVLGDWGNAYQTIRNKHETTVQNQNPANPGDASASQYYLAYSAVTSQTRLDSNTYKQFWITYSSGTITLGTGTNIGQNIVLSATDPNPYSNIKYVGIQTQYGTSGDWAFFECGSCPQGFYGTGCANINQCALTSPCQNGATCSNTTVTGGYSCSCQNGYYGSNCEKLNQCNFNPTQCQNGGHCTNTSDSGSYDCFCLTGYSGQTCQIINTCQANPGICKNGNCQKDNELGGYHCTCDTGFTGSNCETLIDYCTMHSPCGSNGVCTATPQSVGGYSCSCNPGYFGVNCEFQDHCSTNPCQNDGVCQNSIPAFTGSTCICKPGYSGQTCQIINTCEVTPGICKNGNCQKDDDEGGYHCTCDTGFTGINCETVIDFCTMHSPCGTFGTCTPQIDGSYDCSCLPSYFGDNCEFQDHCFSNPCSNDGVCSNNNDFSDFVCTCKTGYSGKTCNLKNQCEVNQNQCSSHGTCSSTDTNGGYECACDNGFEGQNCEQVNNCDLISPCFTGDCVPNLADGSYDCTNCGIEYEGFNCDVVKICNTHPCQNGGDCTNLETPGTYSCSCQKGYWGNNCENINTCTLANPCLNGGQCSNTTATGGYICSNCNTGYYGDNCEKLNQCIKNPKQCQNGGTCSQTNEQGDYSCQCVTGYSGQNCEQCANNWLLFKGVCVKNCGAEKYFELSSRSCKSCEGNWYGLAGVPDSYCQYLCLAPGVTDYKQLAPACKKSSQWNQRCYCGCTNKDAYIGASGKFDLCAKASDWD